MLRKLLVALVACITILIISPEANAQNSKLGSWGIATVLLPGDSLHRFGGYAEVQSRTNGAAFSQFQYYEAKAGLSYDIDKNFTALFGTGTYHTYDYMDVSKGPNTNEFRIWEQMTVTQFLSLLKFEHRYRVEQRWVNGDYRNRFRYRLNMFIPLNNRKIVAKTVFISIFDEIFFTNVTPNFERNRISAALGYQFDKSWIAQAGWINQYNNNLSSTGGNKNNMMIILMYRINRKKAVQREHLPTTND